MATTCLHARIALWLPTPATSAMATTLPSFVELMASLGLENNSKDIVADERSLGSHHSRSSSYSSTCSFASQSSSSATNSQAELSTDISPRIVVSSDSPIEMVVDYDRRRYHRARFSPYAPAIVSTNVIDSLEHCPQHRLATQSHTRRVSLPNVAREEAIRSHSTSPRSGSPSHNVARRSSTLSLTSGHRPEKLVLENEYVANTPISTFLRRKTPQSSPISPTFPHRKRSSSPSLPVSIPTLPTFCFPSQQSTLVSGSISSDTDDEVMSDASSTHLDVESSRRKVRSRKLANKKDVNHPIRRPRGSNNRYTKHRLAPLE
ncbi:hypothetical protein BDY19DRAFT_506260 [Irpex rosettiformis]|uniref:Uncharacterized protein n=1 Tax=Irpex rosettiformis TaxID=378272 RepID=A0ACB8UEV9_9APHY|nr:hypothetical protein BDY19DRAFT_506260 [Irpex rosettiformis]